MIETARPVLESMLPEVTNTKVVCLHRDISTFTGEEIVLLTLAESTRGRVEFSRGCGNSW